jgi:hypothetical protein
MSEQETTIEWVEMGNTSCDHYFEMESVDGDMMCIVCTQCPHGCMVDRKTFNLKSGKLIRIEG